MHLKKIRLDQIKNGRLWAIIQVSGCLGVYPLDMPRTPYRASEGERSQ